MAGNNKGRAYILNNIEFNIDTRMAKRNGSDVDFNNLIHLFEEMGYQVERAMNKTVEVKLNPKFLITIFVFGTCKTPQCFPDRISGLWVRAIVIGH